ncbi:hypothetical protein B0H14DRAFT_2564955 [Mycena olivaceomarginata]|nr:hypothetical protein B0H14DRAFT_2564955 [Mycena olivaceomarginata]
MWAFPVRSGNTHVTPGNETGNAHILYRIPVVTWAFPVGTWVMWAFPVVTWAFPVATGNAHITHVPTGNAHVTTGMRLGMPTHTIYVGDGNDHPYYVWKCHGPSHFLYGNDHSYHVWKLGMTILAIYGSGVVLPIPSVGNGHYCHIWKVWKAWVAQLELLLSSKNGHPLHVNTQEEPWIARSFLPLETHSKQMAMTVTTFILYPFLSPVTLLAVPCQLHRQPSGFIVQVTVTRGSELARIWVTQVVKKSIFLFLPRVCARQGTVFHSLAESLLSTTQQMKYNSINESSQSPPKHPHYSLARKVGISNRCKSIHPRLLPIVGEPVNDFGRRQVEMVYTQDHGRIRGVGSIFAEATQSLLLKQAMAKWTERTKD